MVERQLVEEAEERAPVERGGSGGQDNGLVLEGDECLTAEQRDHRRLEQERADAELARSLAEQGDGGGAYQEVPGQFGRGSAVLATEPVRKGRACRMQLPLVHTFLCCVSLRCGALIIIGCDAGAAVFQTLASLTILMIPELALETGDETLYLGAEMQGRAVRFLQREMRVRVLLSGAMVYFAVKGWRAVQQVDAQALREYLNWKVLDAAVFAVMGVSLHRLWWDGCGFLPLDSCWALRWTYLTNTLGALCVPVYCIWVVWSLFHVLQHDDGAALAHAGFVPRAERERAPPLSPRALVGGALLSPRLVQEHVSGEAPKASPRTTYMV